MSNRTIQVSDDLYAYIQASSLREPGILSRLRTETSQLDMAVMQISPEQGQFMSLLIQLTGARRAIEVGVFTGYSSLCVAMALPDEGEIIACDINRDWTRIAEQFWKEAGVHNKIRLVHGPAIDTLNQLLEEGQAGSFDFAFIDADKTSYLAYYEACLKLVRPGGLIAIDNVLWGGSVIDPGDNEPDTVAIRDFNTVLHQDNRVDLSLLPIGDGLTLARRKNEDNHN